MRTGEGGRAGEMEGGRRTERGDGKRGWRWVEMNGSGGFIGCCQGG